MSPSERRKPGVYIEFDEAWSDPGWTRVPNSIARCRTISRGAKGWVLEMASHSPTWRLTLDEMVEMSADGRDATRARIAELVKAGFVTRVRERDDLGRLGVTVYSLHTQPVSRPAPATSDFPTLAQPTPANPSPANPTTTEDQPLEDQTSEERSCSGPVDQSDRLGIRARDAEATTGRQRAREPDDHGEARAVIDTLRARTGKAITDLHHVELIIRQLLGDRPDVKDRVAYLIGAIRADDNPRRFLPTPTPPRFQRSTA